MADDQLNPALNKNRHNKFTRFLLKSWQPVPTWQSTIILFLLIGLALIGFGVALIVINSNIVEVSRRYDVECGDSPSSCPVRVTLDKKMEQPVFLYYEIDNFYQNHRRYINSRSTKQLAGEKVDDATLKSDCSPVTTNDQMKKTLAADGTTTLDPAATAIPCGLIAKSMFTDRYQLSTFPANVPIPIDDTNIAWPSDKGTKFKNPEPYDPTVQWIDMTDEHFIVWMRTSGLPDFRKLWGRITQDLEAGEYQFTVENTYNVTGFDGKKRIVLSTTGPFGGKNNFLAISYLAVGGVCIAVSLFFFVRWLHYKKKTQ